HARGHRLGFFREGTHDICDVRPTRQPLPSTCDVLERLGAAMRSLGGGEIREGELTENVDASERVGHFDAAQPLDRRVADKLMAMDGLTTPPYVVDTLRVGESSLTLRRHVLAFFQGNRYLLGDLVAHVVERVPIGSGLVDLYAGVGVFAVAAGASRAATVLAGGGAPRARRQRRAHPARA